MTTLRRVVILLVVGVLVGGVSACQKEGSGLRFQQIVFTKEGNSMSCENGYRFGAAVGAPFHVGTDFKHPYDISYVEIENGVMKASIAGGVGVDGVGGFPRVTLEAGESVTDVAAGTFTLLEVRPGAAMTLDPVPPKGVAIFCFEPHPGFEVGDFVKGQSRK